VALWYFFRKDRNQKLILQKFADKCSEGFTNHLRWQTHTNLFRNDFIDKVTGRSLYDLVGYEKNKELMTDLFLMIYKQESVDTIIKDFTRDQIGNYL
jgi:hypothetical protein